MSLSNYNPGQELASIDFSALIGGPLGAIVDAQAKAALSTVDFVKSVGFSPDNVDATTGEVIPGSPIYVSFKFPKLIQPYQPSVQNLTLANGGSGYTIDDKLSLGSTVTITVTNVNTSKSITGFSFITVGAFPSEGNNVDAVNVTVEESAPAPSGAKFNIINTEPIPAQFQEMKLEVPILTMMPIPFIRVEEGSISFNAKITSMEYKNVATEMKFSTSLDVTNTNENKNVAFVGSLNFNKNINTVNLKTNISFQSTNRNGHKIEKTFHMGINIKLMQEMMPEGMEKLLGILEDAIIAQPVTASSPTTP